MLSNVPVSERKITDYEKVVGVNIIDDLKTRAKKLKGLKVLNLSSTAFGGGVAELLYTTVPLLADLGIDISWQVISGDSDFFTVTKNIHNGLQGTDFLLTEHMIKTYEETNILNARSLESDADIIIVHDPQPLAMIDYVDSKKFENVKWVWRAHIDLSEPQQDVLDYISKFTSAYDAVVVTLKEYLKKEMNVKRSFNVAPTIDPLSLKNNDLSKEAVREILQRFGVDSNKPILTQVSRFDPWKDPFGVIDTYRLVKQEIKDLQLLMVASMAIDDPEGWHYFEKTARYAGVDPDIRLFSNVTGVGNIEVNAIQRASDVVIQKSVREGFGLVVSEAMWKEKAVIGTNVGGIKLQINDGKNGFLIDSTEQAAKKTLFLLNNRGKAKSMGENARNYVRDNFLVPRLLSDWLAIYESLA